MATELTNHPDDATTTYTQPTVVPTAKVAAGLGGGAFGTLLVFFLGQFGVTLPPEVAAAVVTLLSFAASYIKKSDTAQGAKKN